MFQMLSQAEIRKWLASLVLQGAKPGPSSRLSVVAVAKHLDMPKATLVWLAKKDTARIGIERQRDLSKFIGLWENGLLELKKGGYKNTENFIVPRETPKVMLKYQVNFGPKGPTLSAAPKPKIPTRLPTMRELLNRN